MASLEARIAAAEEQAGIGDPIPKLNMIILVPIGAGGKRTREPSRAWSGDKKIFRRSDESEDAFLERVKREFRGGLCPMVA